MRKNTLVEVYDILQAICALERQIKSAPLRLSVADPEECSRHLREARHQLHQVLDEVYNSDFHNRTAA